jgi:hypothetical protein
MKTTTITIKCDRCGKTHVQEYREFNRIPEGEPEGWIRVAFSTWNTSWFCVECWPSVTTAVRESGSPFVQWVQPYDCQCRQCGKQGYALDEFTSPHTGLCAECSKAPQVGDQKEYRLCTDCDTVVRGNDRHCCKSGA